MKKLRRSISLLLIFHSILTKSNKENFTYEQYFNKPWYLSKNRKITAKEINLFLFLIQNQLYLTIKIFSAILISIYIILGILTFSIFHYGLRYISNIFT